MTYYFIEPGLPSSGVTPYRSLIRVTPPAVEPVTLAEAKAHCRVDTADDDTYISTLVATARAYVEDMLDISLITTVWEARYDCFPLWEITLPRPPMQASGVVVTYRDESGTTRTLAGGEYQIDNFTTPGRIYPNYAGNWPAVRGDENSVVVRFSSGYGATAASVPNIIDHAILLLVAHWYETRQPVAQGMQMPIPGTFNTLLAAAGWGGYR